MAIDHPAEPGNDVGGHAGQVLTRLESDLDELAGLALSPLSDQEVAELLTACTGLADRLAAATGRIALAADARELGGRNGSRHTGHWWARRTRLTRGEAGRRMQLARDLEKPLCAPVAAALAGGRLSAEQARVITRCLADLPADLDHSVRVRARDHLLELAGEHDARELRILGKRILEVLDPDRFEAEEGKRLRREEERAAATARVTMSDDGHGRTWGRFCLPTLHGELLRNQLLALADPRRQPPTDDSPGSSGSGSFGSGSAAQPGRTGRRGPVITPERLGQALMELIEGLPAEMLPTHAASSVALTITAEYTQLRKDLGVATLAGGQALSAAEARRLACRTGLLPTVLGGESEVLDLGRTRRLFSAAQFKALTIRDRGCTAEGCGLPATICHAHHDQPWSQGGSTDLANARLLCPHHHRLVHNPRYTTRPAGAGRIAFHRRQ